MIFRNDTISVRLKNIEKNYKFKDWIISLTIKREIYISDYETLDELIDLFMSLLYEIVDNMTYMEWLMEFFDINL